MNIKKLFKYKQNGKTIISTHVPQCEYIPMLRLISSSDALITDGSTFTSCIDILETDLEIWYEVDKQNLDIKIATVEVLKESIDNIDMTLMDLITENRIIDIKVSILEDIQETITQLNNKVDELLNKTE